MKHTGSFEDLQAIVRAVGFVVEETSDKDSMKQIRTREGAILNLYSTGTLQFQGKKGPREKLEKSISIPERNIRNTNPNSANKSRTGTCPSTQPKTLGPMMIPAKISPTTIGKRNFLKRESTIGTTKARNTTKRRGIKDSVSSI